jgi:Flp pilus assembly protein TadD
MRRQSSHAGFLAGSLARFLSTAAVTAVLARGLGGCQTMSDITGSLTSSSSKAQAVPDDPQRAVEVYGERYRANPKDAEAALGYGQALRATGQRAQAAAVLEQASLAHSATRRCLPPTAARSPTTAIRRPPSTCSGRAHSPANPDWRILSVQGTTLDKMAKHEEARRYYMAALKIVPEEPSVLSNLGLSYMLTRELPQAEETLRRAYSNPRADAKGAAEPGARGRPAGPLRGSRDHRQGRSARRRGDRQRDLFAGNAEPQGQGQFASSGNKATVPVAALNGPTELHSRRHPANGGIRVGSLSGS